MEYSPNPHQKEKPQNKATTATTNHQDILSTLPKENGWISRFVFKYQRFWFTPNMIKGLMGLQHNFVVENPADTILLATFPKSGTTWLKALIFAISNRYHFDFSQHPLLTKGPHELVPFIEALILQKNPNPSTPTLLSTHIPYSLLPTSIISSKCRIVYLLRDPKDVFVSIWHYIHKLRPKELPQLSFTEGFDLFSRGVYQWGPYWDHVLEYWKAKANSTEKIMFVTFEEMKREPIEGVKSLAEFLGKPFSLEEERDGVVEEIVRLCSFENLTGLEVNKTGVHQFTPNICIENRVFFRKGEVGDWRNHLSEEMAEYLDQRSEVKFDGTGLMSCFAPKSLCP